MFTLVFMTVLEIGGFVHFLSFVESSRYIFPFIFRLTLSPFVKRVSILLVYIVSAFFSLHGLYKSSVPKYLIFLFEKISSLE